MTTISMTDLQDRLPEAVAEAQDHPVVIIADGQPQVVLLGYEQFRRMLKGINGKNARPWSETFNESANLFAADFIEKNRELFEELAKL